METAGGSGVCGGGISVESVSAVAERIQPAGMGGTDRVLLSQYIPGD